MSRKFLVLFACVATAATLHAQSGGGWNEFPGGWAASVMQWDEPLERCPSNAPSSWYPSFHLHPGWTFASGGNLAAATAAAQGPLIYAAAVGSATASGVYQCAESAAGGFRLTIRNQSPLSVDSRVRNDSRLRGRVRAFHQGLGESRADLRLRLTGSSTRVDLAQGFTASRGTTGMPSGFWGFSLSLGAWEFRISEERPTTLAANAPLDVVIQDRAEGGVRAASEMGQGIGSGSGAVAVKYGTTVAASGIALVDEVSVFQHLSGRSSGNQGIDLEWSDGAVTRR